jgi:hypothetical protein
VRRGPAVPLGNRRHKQNCSLAVVQLFVAQAFAWLAFTGSVNSKQARIRWGPVPAYCPGRNSHNVARLRLECYTAGFYEKLTFNHESADADPSTTPQPAPTQTAQAQTNHFALAARLRDISVRRARSTRFAKTLSACSLPLPFTSPSFMSSLGPGLYAVSLALTVTSVSSSTGRRT